jgi:hypothetical protein
MLAKNEHVHFVSLQEPAHDLGRADDRGEHQVRRAFLAR